MSLLRRTLRSRWLQGTLLVLAILLGVAAAPEVRRLLLPKEYFISEIAIRNYRAANVPDAVIDRLKPISGKRFTERTALVADMRAQVGAEDFARHQATLERHIRTRSCWPTESAQKPLLVRDSRGHPAYDRFTFEPVIAQTLLPNIPTQFEFIPGEGGLVVVGKYGNVTWFGADLKPRMTFQVPGVYKGGDDQGALGLALDPGFASNRFFYVAFVDDPGSRNVIHRYTLGPDADAVLKSRAQVLDIPKDAREHFHGIGALHFDSQGAMLVQVGDPTSHAQSWWDYEGKVLRIAPGLGPEGGHSQASASIPEHIASLLKFGSPKILASGLREPFTGTLWRGHLILGDVGGNGPWSTEEINVLSRRGENFGWGVCEDPALHAAFKQPLIVYRRNDPAVTADDPQRAETPARSVIVGVVYDGYSVDRYQGLLDRRLIYGDFFLGFLRGAKLNERAQVEDDVFLAHQLFVSSWRLGADGYLYGVTALGNGGLFRLKLKGKG